MAFLFFLRLFVLQEHRAAACQLGLQLHQGAVGIDGERGCFFFKRFTLSVIPAHSHGDLHENALAPSTRTWVMGRVRNCGHRTSYVPLYRSTHKCRASTPRRVCKEDMFVWKDPDYRNLIKRLAARW